MGAATPDGARMPHRSSPVCRYSPSTWSASCASFVSIVIFILSIVVILTVLGRLVRGPARQPEGRQRRQDALRGRPQLVLSASTTASSTVTPKLTEKSGSVAFAAAAISGTILTCAGLSGAGHTNNHTSIARPETS